MSNTTYKGYFHDKYGTEIRKLKPISLTDSLESSVAEVELKYGYKVLICSQGNDWALFEVNSKMRLLVRLTSKVVTSVISFIPK